MDPLEVTRLIIGLAMILFLPGLTLTMAVWPRSKKDVHLKVIEKLKKHHIKKISLIGNKAELKDLILLMEDNRITTEVNPKGNDKKEACIVIGGLKENQHIPMADFIMSTEEEIKDSIKVEDTIDGTERVALSFGLSVGLVAILGLLLDKTSFGIKLSNVLISLVILILSFSLIFYFRRKNFEIFKLWSNSN
jgi:uncharacterized membrane protein|tara:strand:- start:333 stop:908 length:576 start_codon:yes stop_codon:yes gene_type:complete